MTLSQRILIGDCREVLPTLEAGSVQMCVTSPPYWGLRDYGTARWEGGDVGCDHLGPPHMSDKSTIGRTSIANGGKGEPILTAPSRLVETPYRDRCGKCGARRIDRQLGLEPTPAEYVANMVEVFRLVRRVLKDDATLWINLGDSYNANQGAGFDTNQDGGVRKAVAASPRIKWGRPKNLVGIPWRVAFALQADGWYLRQDIIWAKPNPMPESVTDRCTKAHEYLFLLAKSERYYYDAAAIAEQSAYPGDNRALRTDTRKEVDPMCIDGGSRARTGLPTGETRNRRSVWTVTTQPYAEAHFATFPPTLIEPCILAGSRPGDTVLDPFAGSGTTGQVAEALGRKWTLIELNPAYEKLGLDRTRQTGMVFV